MRLSPLSLRALSILAPLIAAAGPAFGQSATTDPVGFISVSVEPGTVASPKVSLVSPTLFRPVEWQGSISAISGTTISVSGTPWSAGQFGINGQYFVEVASGASAGAWTDIQSCTTNSLTTLDDLSAFASASSTVRIRKHTKLTDFLGVTNSAGLKGAASLANADEVHVYDGSVKAIYFYYDASDSKGPAGWYDSNFQSAVGVVIAPHEGIAILRKVPGGTLTFVSMGTVKTGNTFFPIRTGLNVVGTVSAKGLTLANCGLYTGDSNTGLKGATAPFGADEVTISAGGVQTVYWYYDGSDHQGTPGWYDYNYQSANSVAVAPGASLVINRKGTGAAFNWPIPSPAAF